MKIGMQSNIDEVARSLDAAARRQVPFAAALTLTRAAQKVKQAEEHEMRDVFDRPTPYTMRSLFVKPATRSRLEATVGFKDFAGKGIPATKFLQPQVAGGARPMKRFESALRLAGVLPFGYLAVPGAAADLDAYGNMSRGQIVQILSYFRAFSEAGYRANMTDKRRSSLARGGRSRYGVVYFVVRPGTGLRSDLFPGVWKREIHGFGSRIRPVLRFVSRANYSPIFNFDYVAEKTVEIEIPRQWPIALAEALGSAR